MRLKELAAVAVIFVISGVALGIGADVLGEVATDVAAGDATNAVNNATPETSRKMYI